MFVHCVDNFFYEGLLKTQEPKKLRLSKNVAMTRTRIINLYAKINKWRMLKKSKKGFFGGFSGQKNIKNEYFDSV